jgi:hypothetical protein
MPKYVNSRDDALAHPAGGDRVTSEPWFSPLHNVDCASQERLPDPGPEGEGVFDERGWYHPPCDCRLAESGRRT